MIRLSRIPFLALIAVLALVVASCGDGDDAADTTAPADGATTAADGESGEDWPDKLVIAAVPAEATEDLGVSWGPFVDALSDELGGIEIETFSASDYGAVIEAMIAERVDLAFLGAFAYYLAQQQADHLQAIAANIITEDGMMGYHSLGITQPDNEEVSELADFAGRTTCFVDPGSTSGYLFPTAGLIGEDIDPEADVTPVFAGGHDTSLLSVIAGDCEVGFFHEFTLIDIREGRFTDATEDEFKIVWESPIIPSPPLVVNTNLPSDFVQALQDAVTKIDAFYLAEEGYCDDYPDLLETTEDGREACLIRQTYGYAAVEPSFYDPITEVCERTNAAACQEE